MELGEFLSQNSFVILMGVISGVSAYAVNGYRLHRVEKSQTKLEIELENAKGRDSRISERLIIIETKLEYIREALDDLKRYQKFPRSSEPTT